MRRFGLAFSGGGFRATLFHLGVVRYLREAGRLDAVTHITAVSGGSILAAHLVQNWARYNGPPEAFDAAAGEILRLVQCDVRNRIVRRYPLAMLGRTARWLTLRPTQRQLTLTGLLERHYRQLLFGDTCLHELPESPRLYLLATNLSEGRLCSFSRGTMLMHRRVGEGGSQFDQVPAGLATLAMAVTASSAFPGFFPPYQLTAAELGAIAAPFERQAFTDGGVYDNLAIRMFRYLERPWLAHEVEPTPGDCGDLEVVVAALRVAASDPTPGPLPRLAELVQGGGGAGSLDEMAPAQILDRLWRVLCRVDLTADPAFGDLDLPADARQEVSQPPAHPERGRRIWLNRQVVDAAFRAAIGRPCFVTATFGFDGVLVSDAGKTFKVAAEGSHGGLVRTAVRSTDIVMNRVWELENETFSGTPGFVFARITRTLSPEEDPQAPHPEVQRQVRDIRTDFDRFSPLEVQSLVQHGYCVGRAACREHPEIFGPEPATPPPWDPLAAQEAARPTAAAAAARVPAALAAALPAARGSVPAGRAVATATVQARTLQRSAERRVWSTLFDVRDWVSYLYIPILVPILVLLPYYAYQRYNQSQVAWRLIRTMAQGSPDLDPLTNLLQNGPAAPFAGLLPEPTERLRPPNDDEFEVVSDNRVLDFRATLVDSAGRLDPEGWIYGYRRVRFRKRLAGEHPAASLAGGSVAAALGSAGQPPVPGDDPEGDTFLVHLRAPTAHLKVRCGNAKLNPRLKLVRAPEGQESVYEVVLDTRLMPPGQLVDAVIEFHTLGASGPWNRSLRYTFETHTQIATFWLLLPTRETLDDFELIRYPTDRPGPVEAVTPWRRVVNSDLRVLFFGLLSVKSGYTYECRWSP